jgi:small subunit ribosomal protein S17e
MGRIKTTLIKRVSMEIVDRNRDKLKDNFEENKKIIEEVADIPSKKLKNAIVGYVTRQIKSKEV